jgi:multicomponent Na+:H+ antiporter subunit E
MFVLWLMLTFMADPQLVLAGVVIASIAAYLFSELFIEESGKESLNPKRWLWMVLYVLILAKECILASLDVARRVLHPKMPIKPCIIRIPTHLESDWEITLLSNSITLTPGTLVIDFNEDENCLYVHWLYMREREIEAAKREISEVYEKYLGRIFE